MTLKMAQIRRVAHDYASFFPDWHVLHKCGGLARLQGPVLQGILFNRSSGDDYRPTGFIRVLTAPREPNVLELTQPLRRAPDYIAEWYVDLRSHAQAMQEIVRELHRQIKPALDAPLDPVEVLKLYEKEALTRRNSPEAYSLATLNAYLGFRDRAHFWCHRYLEQIPPDEGRRRNWEVARLEFLNQLKRWMEASNVRERLDEIILQEREKLGLQDESSESKTH